eukprot:6136781-Alexandrium_andersonii.AAC.1
MKRGVRQGGTASPLLWVVILDFLMCDCLAQWRKRGYGFKLEPLGCRVGRGKQEVRREPEESLCSLLFADDINLFAETPSELRAMFHELEQALAKGGLVVQPSKCRFSCNEFWPGRAFRYKGIVLETVRTSVRILGVEVQLDA